MSVVLETSRGPTTINGESLLSTFMVLGPLAGFKLHQSIVHYRWDAATRTFTPSTESVFARQRRPSDDPVPVAG